MIIGTIYKGIGGFYYVKTTDGEIAECRARGKFRRLGITPMVGDLVDITIATKSPITGAVDKIHERKNSLVRPPVANIDCIAIVVAAASPSPDFSLIDKLTVSAEQKNIEVIIVINKTDLASYIEIEETYKKSGYDCFVVCAKNGDGIEELKQKISGKITAFAGNSGVGKSSILNYFGFELKTGDVSKIERGKHTTRHIELMPYENGFVMDTPGFSLLEVFDVKSDDLKKYFPEFIPFEGKCKFNDCIHVGSKSGKCAVVKATEEGYIAKTRYENYVQIYNLLKEREQYD